MSIYAYVGMPGSGKSYDVVANQIMPALRAGRTVVTNVALKHEAIRAVCPDADLREFPTELIAADPPRIEEFVIPGCVLVLDEVWRIWPSGQKTHQVPEPFKKLLAEHRHMVDDSGNSTQIVLVTQDLAQIGMFARQLVEQTFYHTKLTAVGASGSYRIDIYQGPRTGPAPPPSARVNTQLGRYSKDVFQFYESHTMRKGEGSGANEKSMDRRGMVWKRPALIVGAIVCVGLTAWAIATLGAMFGEEETSVASAGASVATPRAASGLLPTSTAQPRTPTSPGRVSAIVQAGPDSYAILEAGGRAWRVQLGKACDQTRFGWVCSSDGREFSFEAAPRAAAQPSAPGSFLAKPDQ